VREAEKEKVAGIATEHLVPGDPGRVETGGNWHGRLTLQREKHLRKRKEPKAVRQKTLSAGVWDKEMESKGATRFPGMIRPGGGSGGGNTKESDPKVKRG